MKTTTIRITRDEGKRDLAQSPTRRDGSETGYPVGFFFPKRRTYSPPPKCAAFWRRWYPFRWSGRALSEGDAGAFRSLRRTTDDAGKAPLVRAAVGTVMDSASRNCRGAAAHCAARHLLLQNLPLAGFANGQAVGSHLASFYGRRDGLLRLLRGLAGTNTKEKRNQRKEVTTYRNISFGSKGRQSWSGKVRLRSVCVFELLQDL